MPSSMPSAATSPLSSLVANLRDRIYDFRCSHFSLLLWSSLSSRRLCRAREYVEVEVILLHLDDEDPFEVVAVDGCEGGIIVDGCDDKVVLDI